MSSQEGQGCNVIKRDEELRVDHSESEIETTLGELQPLEHWANVIVGRKLSEIISIHSYFSCFP